MKPPEARILHVEDSDVARRLVAEAASDIGASVVASVASFKEARDALELIEELGVNVILTDDTLSTDKPHEGRYVYDIAHAKHPDVHVLSVSSGESMSQVLGIPHVSDKGTDSTILKAAIEAL
jgi:CheY-like chemotaxis protein